MSTDPNSPNFAAESLAAHATAAKLVGVPWPERLKIVRENRSYAVPSFIELATSLARDAETPLAQREQWARLAVEAAANGRSRRVEALEPIAWAVLGNIYRVQEKPTASRAAFLRCHGLRARLTDPLELADTFALEAGFWRDMGIWFGMGWARDPGNQQRAALAWAAELIGEALRLAAPSASESAIGCYETNAGMIAEFSEHWSAATTMYLSALDRLDPVAHPRLTLAAGHNLAQVAVRLGHLDVATWAVLRLVPNYNRFELRVRLNRDQLIASIAKARGDMNEAELRFNAVRSGFKKLSLPCQTAEVDLELASLAAERGQWATAEHFATRASRVLSAAGAPYAAHAATGVLGGRR